MDTETDGQEPAPDAAAPVAEASPAPVENASEAAAEQQTPADSGAEPGDEGAEAERKRVPWFQKRIDEVTRLKYEAQREAAYWRGLAEAGGQRHEQAPQAQPGQPPREEDFNGDYDAYLRAIGRHEARQEMLLERQREQVAQSARTFAERVDKARDKLPDYDLVVGDPTLPITPEMADIIRESEVGPELSYKLGKDRSEAARIAALPPHRQAAELARIEARLIATATPAPTPAPRPNPPPPPQTFQGLSAGLQKEPKDMSMAEYMDWHRTRDKA